jgi:hypothetical protein
MDNLLIFYKSVHDRLTSLFPATQQKAEQNRHGGASNCNNYCKVIVTKSIKKRPSTHWSKQIADAGTAINQTKDSSDRASAKKIHADRREKGND